MKQRIIVSTEPLRKRAALLCSQIPLDESHVVIIAPHVETRSELQKRYYFHIVGIMADHFGYTKNALHVEMKKLFLLPIFVRDDKAMELLVRGVIKEGEDALQKLAEIISINQASVKQMSEYITELKRHAAEYDIRLPIQEDYK